MCFVWTQYKPTEIHIINKEAKKPEELEQAGH